MTLNEKRLQDEIDALKQKLAAKNKVSFKVSPKGAVSVYGLGRFPVTLYGEQWERVAELMPELKKFMAEHKGELSTKD